MTLETRREANKKCHRRSCVMHIMLSMRASIVHNCRTAVHPRDELAVRRRIWRVLSLPCDKAEPSWDTSVIEVKCVIWCLCITSPLPERSDHIPCNVILPGALTNWGGVVPRGNTRILAAPWETRAFSHNNLFTKGMDIMEGQVFA